MLQLNFKKVCENLFDLLPNGKSQIDTSKCSSRNDYMFARDFTLLNNQSVRIINTFLPPRTKKNLLELTNFELSDGFCQDLIVNAHGTEQFVRINECLNYRIFVYCSQISINRNSYVHPLIDVCRDIWDCFDDKQVA